MAESQLPSRAVVPPISGELTVTSPVDGTVIAAVPNMTDAEVATLAARLRAAQPEWEALGTRGRGKWLGQLRDWILDNETHLMSLIQQETGKVYGDASIEPSYGLMVLNYWIKNAGEFLRDGRPKPASPTQLTKQLTVSYRPFPLVGVISPWNWPLVMPLLDIPAALMAGCAVLSKPSELTPLTWLEVVRGWREDIGAPDVLGCATGAGTTGRAVVDAVDMVQFTGSVRTGRAVAARAGERLIPCSLELGGKDPMIVLNDADIERTSGGAVWGAFVNAGQGCIAIERAYVEAGIYDDFVREVVSRTNALRVGTDIDAPFTADIGAMSSEAQLAIVERHVDDAVAKGAKVLAGGKRKPGPGFYYLPTVLVDVDHTMDIMREETFGPVLPIMKVPDAESALALANDSAFGLSGSVWTKDRRKGEALAERLEVGGGCVNNVCMTNFQLPLPSGGWKDSGIGARFGAAGGIRKYTRAQARVSERVEAKSEAHWYPFTPFKGGLIAKGSRFIEARDWRRRLGRSAGR
ncbi:aldehyde dehydrogenase family protein [Nocardia sp. ET3-3]|uniref:Aldehyde dehydrogenase family protein n=1 Tax=Nocardia terrae TaxID=2675851 RepID=A0A7K1V2D8_9NOCA|nr:aldehyde dehydrogenase family protein [Nocardia terrae]MVU80765.1 aldehyde dehydrogenase family protein [Nocardia terrae]